MASGRRPVASEEKNYQRERRIGAFPESSVEMACGKASELSAALAKWKSNDFQDPAPFEKKSGDLTLEELIIDYIEKHLRQHAKRPEVAEKDLRYVADGHLAAWKNGKIGTIRRSDIQSLVGRNCQVPDVWRNADLTEDSESAHTVGRRY